MLTRLFAEESARDGYERTGRLIGNVIGVAVYATLIWVVVLGFV